MPGGLHNSNWNTLIVDILTMVTLISIVWNMWVNQKEIYKEAWGKCIVCLFYFGVLGLFLTVLCHKQYPNNDTLISTSVFLCGCLLVSVIAHSFNNFDSKKCFFKNVAKLSYLFMILFMLLNILNVSDFCRANMYKKLMQL